MTLRLLHTSDWHLGRSLHEASLLEDQAWVLDRLVEAVREERPDAVVVAGDVYDRAVPPAEAVALLDEALTRLAELGARVILTAGNHDSAERLSFGARLLAGRGVHLCGALAGAATPIELPGLGLIYGVPFLDPEAVRVAEGDDSLRGHAAATERIVSRARADAAGRALPAVLVAHAFVQGARATPDSERPLVVGTAGNVPAAALAGFDYVALGHLHAPQEVAPGVRYSGSLLKYSFSEADQAKGVLLVEVDKGRPPVVRRLALGARRDVVRLSGTLAGLLADPAHEPHRGSLLEVTLEDDAYLLEPKRKLQERFPHVVSVRRRELQLESGQGHFARTVAGAGQDDLKLFEAFFQNVTGGPPTGAELAVFREAVEALDRQERAQ
jgi:exonuclease SbcD